MTLNDCIFNRSFVYAHCASAGPDSPLTVPALLPLFRIDRGITMNLFTTIAFDYITAKKHNARGIAGPGTSQKEPICRYTHKLNSIQWPDN